MNDLYGILELGSEATPDEIKANYRRLAMKWHPDRNGGSPKAEETFKRISEAYSVLSDPMSRQSYDEGRVTGRDAEGGYERGFSGFGSFTAEQAAAMFMNEMNNLAIELTMQNVGWRDIAREMMRRGCPEATAVDIARGIELRRKAMIRGRARPYFLRSGFSGFIGFVLFALFARSGFGIIGFIGLLMFLSGAYNLIRALYFITTGNAPARKSSF